MESEGEKIKEGLYVPWNRGSEKLQNFLNEWSIFLPTFEFMVK